MSFLLVEDDEDYAAYLQVLIGGCCSTATIEVVDTAAAAIDALLTRPFDVGILDYRLREGTGLDVLNNPEVRALPTAFIFLSAHTENSVAMEALQQGALDFLVKARFEAFELEKAVTYALYRKRKETEMLARALRDPLTGLGNRALFDEQLRTLTEQARRHDDKTSVLFIDLDGFKPINDIHGHDAGDKVLREVARRLLAVTRVSDVVTRPGGDEFAIILPRLDESANIPQIVKKVRRSIVYEPYEIDGKTLNLGASIGFATYPDDTDDIDRVVQLADERMYEEKASHKAQKRA